MKIFAVDKHGDREEIKDLYWFEENSIHNFTDSGWYEQYTFEFEIEKGDKVLSPSEMFWDERGPAFETPPDNIFVQLGRLEEAVRLLDNGDIEIPSERLAILDS